MVITYVNYKNGSSQYVSPILAISNNLRHIDREIIVLDSSFMYFKKVPLYQHIKDEHSKAVNLIKQACIIDYYDDDFLEHKWDGYEDLILNFDLMNRLIVGELIAINALPQLKEYCKKPIIPSWFKIDNEDDIANLMEVSSNFNDTTLEKVVENNDKNLELCLSISEGYINIRFENIMDNQLYNKVGQILDSKLSKKDNYYIFKIIKGFGGWDYGIDVDTRAKGAFIKCEKICWKIEIEFQDK